MAIQWLQLAAFATLLLVAFPAAVSAQSKPEAFFVLGDSIADDGNRNASDPRQNQPWRSPYGITWPGRPTGRFSNGYISTDYFADFLRVGYTPPPYASIKNTTATKYYKRGVDFAVGASGIFQSFGFPTYGQQVDQLKGLVGQHPDIFSRYTLQRSIVYISYSGNDYLYQLLINNNGSTVITNSSIISPEFVNSVVQGIEQTVRSLYIVGFRNFFVTYAPQLGRTPLLSVNGSANEALTPLVTQHNELLRTALDRVSYLPGAHVVALDLYKTLNYVSDNAQWFGFSDTTTPCCTATQPGGSCGDVDAQGNPLYQVCQNPADFFWWDVTHPTQASWNAISNLLNSGYNFTDFTPNLVIWFNLLNLTDNAPRNEGRVSRDVQQAVQAVNATGQFNLLLDVINRSNSLPYAPKVLSDTWRVTVFLPTDSSIIRQLGSNPVSTFLQNSPEVGLSVLSVHAVYGWWPAQRLLALPNGSSLKTVAGTALFFYNEPGGLFVGAPSAQGGVRVVLPDIYNSSYTGVIHGIDGVIIPSYLRPLPGAA